MEISKGEWESYNPVTSLLIYASGRRCNFRRVSLSVKKELYETVVMPMMMHGTETWGMTRGGDTSSMLLKRSIYGVCAERQGLIE